MSTAAVSRADRSGAVLADLLPRAATASRARLRDAALAAGGAAFIGIAAQIAVPVPGSPVPATGQTFAVLLVGTSLGAGRGFLSLALYVLAGMAGAPVFADGVGSSNFGYVLGMLLAATVVGSLARRGGDRGALRTAGTMAVGSLVIYAVGVPYLAVVANLSLAEAVAVGVVPFLIGDSLKALLAMRVLPAAWRLAGRRD